ncbi:hypothetical protein NBE26_19260, partial [Salmonella sp. C3241]
MVAKSGKKYRSDDTEAIRKNLGLGETINLAAGAVQKTGDEMNGKL